MDFSEHFTELASFSLTDEFCSYFAPDIYPKMAFTYCADYFTDIFLLLCGNLKYMIDRQKFF